MPTLEQIAETGIFSLGTSGFHREFVPFDEELTAESFAEEINSGRLSVRDAYINFWSYEEDAELWGLPKDGEWRALLPKWERIVEAVADMLTKPSSQNELVAVLSENCIRAAKKLRKGDYNPFFDDAYLTLRIVGRGDMTNQSASQKLYRSLYTWDDFVHPFDNLFNSPKFYGFLCGMLDSKSKFKQDAIKIIALGKVRQALDFLIKYLKTDEAPNLKKSEWKYYSALYALGEIGDEKAVDPILEYLSDPNNPGQRLAVMALGKIGGEKARQYIRNLYEQKKQQPVNVKLRKIYNELPDVTSLTVKALLQIGNEEDRKMVYSDLRRGNETLEHEILIEIQLAKAHDATIDVIRYLDSGRQDWELAMKALATANGEVATSTLAKYLSDPDKRCQAAESLGDTGEKMAIPAITTALHSLYMQKEISKEDQEFAKKCVCSLVKLDKESILPQVFEAIPLLPRSDDFFWLSELHDLNSAIHIDYLSKALEHDDFAVRIMALRLLNQAHFQPNNYVRKMAVEDPNYRIREQAVELLGKNPNKENLGTLHYIVNNLSPGRKQSHQVYVACHAIPFLAKFDFDRFKPKLMELCTHGHPLVSEFAVRACENVYIQQDIHRLLFSILERDNDYNACCQAVKILAKTYDPESIELMFKLVKKYQVDRAPLQWPQEEEGRADGLQYVILEQLKNIGRISDDRVLELTKTAEYNTDIGEMLEVLRGCITSKNLPKLFEMLEDTVYSKWKKGDKFDGIDWGFEAKIVEAITGGVTRDWLLSYNINLNRYRNWSAKNIHQVIKPQGYNPPVKRLAA